MKRLIAVVFIGVLVTVSMRIGNSTSLSEWLTKPGGSPPVITHWYAVEELEQGDIWKIYLEAKDPDGDMIHFDALVYQLGYGSYAPDYVVVKKGHRGEMRGYLRLFSSVSLPEFTQVTVALFIRDKGANKSNTVVLPLEFSQGAKQGPPPPPFDVGPLDNLGTIMVDLRDPDDSDDDSDSSSGGVIWVK